MTPIHILNFILPSMTFLQKILCFGLFIKLVFDVLIETTFCFTMEILSIKPFVKIFVNLFHFIKRKIGH